MQIRIHHVVDADAAAPQIAATEDAAICVVQHVGGHARHVAPPAPHIRTVLQGRLFVHHERLALELNEHLIEVVTDRRRSALEADMSAPPAILASIVPPALAVAPSRSAFCDDGTAQQLLAARYSRDDVLLRIAHRIADDCATAKEPAIDDGNRVSQLLARVYHLQAAFAADIARCPGRTLASRVEMFGRLRRVQAMLEAPFFGDIAVPRMAELVNLTLSHFIRTWKRVFGDTPHRFVARAKVRMATQLLSGSTHTISAIGQMLGFDDRCAFARWYRHETGETATDTRRAARAGARAVSGPAPTPLHRTELPRPAP